MIIIQEQKKNRSDFKIFSILIVILSLFSCQERMESIPQTIHIEDFIDDYYDSNTKKFDKDGFNVKYKEIGRVISYNCDNDKCDYVILYYPMSRIVYVNGDSTYYFHNLSKFRNKK
jgi:hypothetical protein